MIPKLSSVPLSIEVRLRNAFSFNRNDEHEWKCIRAIRQREHPAWSQQAVSYRVTQDKRLRAVR